VAIDMGPVLSFRGVSEENGSSRSWDLSALIVCSDSAAPDRLHYTHAGISGEVEPEPLWSVAERTAFRFQFSAVLAEAPTVLTYEVMGSEPFRVHVPAAGRPPRMAYESCNGFSSPKEMKGVDDKFVMWGVMAQQHEADPFHLLLQGGDQVYADSVWESVPALREWSEMGFDDGNRHVPEAGLDEDLGSFYFELYVQRWRQPQMAAMLARVPSIAMWDDHDILDGWGSYPEARQQSPVFQAIWPAARRAFATFQQHLLLGEQRPGAIAPTSGFTFGHVVGPVAILAVDMRSQRTPTQVLAPDHWDAVFAWVDGLESVDHLILMSSIPVVYPGFDTLEKMLGALPGQQSLEDDLRDHWNSRRHKGERLRLIHRLLALSAKCIRATIVSGDVHVAALGLIESTRNPARDGVVVINQLISSAMVHPGPPAAVLFALRYMLDSEDEIDQRIVGKMSEFPGTQARFVGGRNFLALDPDPPHNDERRIWANWFVERDEQGPYVKVIHPLESGAGYLPPSRGL
jgi:hypothetical protein